jgi:glycosyltransferase involved in cell wall biosynthesis
VIDATILIPTHDHAELVPFAVRSALGQTNAEVEVFVVGDGVADTTRNAIAPFVEDPRVTFFDNPKGERHGEAYRHVALQHARGHIVCYLSDDDLLLPDHVSELMGLLDGADFAHSAPFGIAVDGTLSFWPIDISRPEYQAMLARGKWNAISLTGAGHTLDAYRRLPNGWRPAPADVWTDLHMWRQFLTLPGFRGRTGTRLTALHFPSPDRADLSPDQRREELAQWWERLGRVGVSDELDREASDAARRAAVALQACAHHLERELAVSNEALRDNERALLELTDLVEVIQGTRTWRARDAVLRFRLARKLLARSAGSH